MQHLIFETERLYVRRFTAEDSDNFFLLNSDPDVMQYIRPLKNREESVHFLHENIEFYASNPMTGRWSVHEKDTDRFVGTFAIIPLDDSDDWQLGYALLKSDWGKGYATELTLTGIEYSFRKMLLPKILAVTEVSNDKSKHVLLKTGFAQLDNTVEHGKEICLFEFHNNAVVETERLLIAALDTHQLELYLQRNSRLEEELGLKTGDRELAEDLRRMIDVITMPAMRSATEKNYFFYTIWIVIDKTHNRMVAELGFKGLPNARGEVEIGYASLPGFRGEGIMTEAVAGILAWARQFAGVKFVTAQTDPGNKASIRVLEKNEFALINKDGERLVWSKSFDASSWPND